MRSGCDLLEENRIFVITPCAAFKVREGEPSRPNTGTFATKTSTGKTGTTRQKVSVISSKEVSPVARDPASPSGTATLA